MAFDDDDYALMKRMAEQVEQIKWRLTGTVEVGEGDDLDVDDVGIADIIEQGFSHVVRAIDRLTAAIEKLQAPKGE